MPLPVALAEEWTARPPAGGSRSPLRNFEAPCCRNIQLALFSALIALAALFASGELLGRRRRLLHGFTAMTWAVVLTYSAGGEDVWTASLIRRRRA